MQWHVAGPTFAHQPSSWLCGNDFFLQDADNSMTCVYLLCVCTSDIDMLPAGGSSQWHDSGLGGEAQPRDSTFDPRGFCWATLWCILPNHILATCVFGVRAEQVFPSNPIEPAVLLRKALLTINECLCSYDLCRAGCRPVRCMCCQFPAVVFDILKQRAGKGKALRWRLSVHFMASEKGLTGLPVVLCPDSSSWTSL